MTHRNDKWVSYLEHSNGTVLEIDSRDFWSFDDFVLRKVKDHVVIKGYFNDSGASIEDLNPILATEHMLGSY